MAVYRYLLCDLITNQVLAELPFVDVSFDQKINGAGGFTGRLPLADPRIQTLLPIPATIPGRTALYVDRDGVLVWGGIIWTRSYTSSSSSMTVTGLEFESYFARCFIDADANFAATDQLTIAQSIITTAQAVTGQNIGVTVGTEVSGVLRDRTYFGFELRPALEALQQLSAVSGGFDYAIDVAYSGGVPTKTLRLGYPRRGVTAANSGWLWEYPGNAQGYSWPEDATRQALAVYDTGAGTGPGLLLSTASNATLIAAGVPRLSAKFAYSDVTVPATLAAHAAADLAALQAPVVVPKIEVRGDIDPVVGTYIVGDEIRLRITDDRFPGTTSASGLDITQRIIAFAVRPGSDAESVTITLGAPVP